MKQTIRLTESKLHNIIAETITQVLNEMSYNSKPQHKNVASAKLFREGKIVVETDLEECQVRWAYLRQGEVVDEGEMDIEVYLDGTWLPYEETHRPQRWIPKPLEPVVYKLFKKLGMRDDDE